MAWIAADRRGSESPEAVFDAWFARHGDDLRSFSTRLTGDPAAAEDVVQETFARAWANLDELRARPEVAPWLYRVARNLCVDTHRARRRLVSTGIVHSVSDDGLRPDAADPLRHVEREEERRLVREAMATLSARHRDVLHLRDIEGMAYEELARRHGLSGESARAVLLRARRRLRDQLRTMGNGIFSGGPWVRDRIADVVRRTGGDRLPVEPLAAAVVQYVAVAAGVVSMALGSATPAAGAAGSAITHDGPATAGPLVTASVEVAAGPVTVKGAFDGGNPIDGPFQPPRPEVTFDVGPDDGIPPNPKAPDGVWVGTTVEFYPENTGPAKPVVVPAAEAVCGTKPEFCAPGGQQAGTG